MNRDRLIASLRNPNGGEAERLVVYDDATGKPIIKGSVVVGNPTIGVGRNLAGRGITSAESAQFLNNDLDAVAAELTQRIPWWLALDDARQEVLAELAFNMGTFNFVSGWPGFLAHVKAGEYEPAASMLGISLWARQVGTMRKERVCNLLRS